MEQLLLKNRYFVATMVLLVAITTGCEKIENTPPTQNDSLAVVPVGPGTQPDVITPPDTPKSEQDSIR